MKSVSYSISSGYITNPVFFLFKKNPQIKFSKHSLLHEKLHKIKHFEILMKISTRLFQFKISNKINKYTKKYTARLDVEIEKSHHATAIVAFLQVEKKN